MTGAAADPDACLEASDRLVESVDGTWIVEVQGDPADAVARLTRKLVQADIPIYRISPVRRDLETLFRELNEEDV